MSDAYRESSGTRCPRCDAVLVENDDGGLACRNGCGEWLPNKLVLAALGALELRTLGRPGFHHKATPLPPTRCLVCGAGLDDLYRAIDSPTEVLTLGRCASHGVWLEGRGREAFETAYAAAIAKHGALQERARRTPPPPPTVEERIRELEARVLELAERVSQLELTRRSS